MHQIFEIEDVDILTNRIMDEIRDTLEIDCDTDLDDDLYGKVHEIVKDYLI
jgi:hypothetical protein